MPAPALQEEQMSPLLAGTEGTHPRDRVLPLAAERQQLQLRELLQNHLQAGMLLLLQRGGQALLQPINQLQLVLQPIVMPLPAERQQLQLRELLQNHLQAGMLPLLQQGGQAQLQPVNQLQIVLQPIAQPLHAERQQLQLGVQQPLAVSRLLSPEGALQDQ